MRANRMLAPALIAATLAGVAPQAMAAAYPVSGIWTYDATSDTGPAKLCSHRRMTFQGDMRRDTGSGAPEYKNISVSQSDTDTWRVVDEFFTGMIRGRVGYTLRQTNPDRIELRFDAGSTSRLQRCE